MCVCDTHEANEVEELDDGRVEYVVARGVGLERLDDRLEQVGLDDVLVVGLLLEADRLAQEAQRRYFCNNNNNNNENNAKTNLIMNRKRYVHKARNWCLDLRRTRMRLSRSLLMM